MSALPLLGEGFESALLTCSLILLIPGMAVGVAARDAAIAAMSSFAVGVLGLSWIRFSDRGGGFSNLLIAAGLLVAVLVLAAPLLRRRHNGGEQTLPALVAGLTAGAASAELWRPCVGEHFGQLLNSLPGRSLSGLALMAVYLVGTLSPLVVIGALRSLTPETWRAKIEPVTVIVGSILLAALAVTTALGFHEALVSRLFLWSVDRV